MSSSYARTVEQLNQAAAEGPKVRVDYRCAAHGCPNAGSMDDTGPGTGRCYHHWRETDRSKWDAITQAIRADFKRFRNWTPTEFKEEIDSMHVASGARNSDPKAWARRLEQREKDGDGLTKTQRDMWRTALQWLAVENSDREERLTPQTRHHSRVRESSES